MAGETYTTYDQVGIKEDVSDVISMITPTKTPFQASIKKETVDSTLFEWQEDSIRAVGDNAQLEGADAADTARTPTVMRTNRTQIFEETFKISNTAERVKKYGRKSEVARETVKTGKALKRDLEHTLVGLDQAAVTGDELTTARRMASYMPQIAAATTEAGGTAALTETMLLNNLEDIYDAGGDASIFMIKPSDSLIVAAFAAIAETRKRDFGTGTKVVNVVDVYASPFGTVRVVLNRFLLATAALTYDPMNWKLAVLRDWFRTPLAIVGDAVRHQIVGEFSLKHNNQSASGLIEAIT